MSKMPIGPDLPYYGDIDTIRSIAHYKFYLFVQYETLPTLQSFYPPYKCKFVRQFSTSIWTQMLLWHRIQQTEVSAYFPLQQYCIVVFITLAMYKVP